MTLTPNTTTKRKPGRPRKTQPGTPSLEPNPFEASLKASREAYDSTRGIARNPTPPQLTVLQGGKASPESHTSKASRDTTTKGSTASNASALASSGQGDSPLGPQILPPFPSLRAHGKLLMPRDFVNSLAPELLCAWAEAFIATGKRQQWLIDTCPQLGRENNRYRADVVREIETQQVTQAELLRLKSEEVMSDLDRRRKLKAIAESPEHPMKGWADNLKAIELDARHDPESCMAKSSREQSTVALPPINLFFLPQGAARPTQLVEPAQPALDC